MIQILDSNDLVDLSAVAQSEFMFDKPRLSKSVPNCVIHCRRWILRFSKIELNEPKLLLIGFVEPDVAVVFVFSFDDPIISKNMKNSEK